MGDDTRPSGEDASFEERHVGRRPELLRDPLVDIAVAVSFSPEGAPRSGTDVAQTSTDEFGAHCVVCDFFENWACKEEGGWRRGEACAVQDLGDCGKVSNGV